MANESEDEMIPLSKARTLGLTRATMRTLRNAAAQGHLKATKPGSEWMTTPKAVKEWEQSEKRRHRSVKD